MNGMTAKKQRRDRSKRFTDDGLPRDSTEWTEEDWRVLNNAIATAIEKIRARHEEHSEAVLQAGIRSRKDGWHDSEMS